MARGHLTPRCISMTLSHLAVAIARPLGMRPLPLHMLRLLAAAGLLLAALAAAAPIRAQEQVPDLVTSPAAMVPEPSEPSFEQAAASPAAESDLWTRISNRQQEVKSARMDGKLTMAMPTMPTGESVPVTATMTMQGDLSGDDFDLRMTVGADDLAMDMRMVLVGEEAYLNMQDSWMSMSRSEAIGQAPPRAELPRVSGDRVTLTLQGEDEVRGVPCEVYAFVLDPGAVAELARAGMISAQSIEARFDEMSGDVCVGTEDGFARRLNMNVRVTANPSDDVPGEKMDVKMAYELFDINSPDIVIRPPEDATSG